MATLFQAAIAAGETRKEVWYPLRRRNGRPNHGFRACFMAELEEAGVTGKVIQALVGHARTETYGRHYTGVHPLMPRMRDAVDLIPDIDWDGPDEESLVDNVISMRRDSVSR
jgi:integrase